MSDSAKEFWDGEMKRDTSKQCFPLSFDPQWEENSYIPTEEDVAVGDLNSNEKGTGARKSGGKVAFSMVPLHLLAGVARVLMFGAQKYNLWNWSKGMVWSECFNCACRHLFKWYYLREEYDEETGEHHLDHVMCNILFLRHYSLEYKEGDDRPPASANFTKESLDNLNQRFKP